MEYMIGNDKMPSQMLNAPIPTVMSPHMSGTPTARQIDTH